MRIGVDCHVLTGKFQGSRTYLLNLYNAILSLRPQHDFFFFGHWSRDYRPFGPNANYVSTQSHSRWKRLTYETYFLIKKYQIDLFHTNYIAPLLLPCRSLLTVHDILFESHPQYFTRDFVFRSKVFVRYSTLKASQIHTVSHFSKQAIESRYRIPPDRIHVIPNGVDQEHFCSNNKEESVRFVRRHFGLKDYILTVGRLEPRKNHIAMLKSYLRFKTSSDFSCPLVIIGQRDFNCAQLFTCIQDYNLNNDVWVLENVEDEHLPHFYRAASCFLYPSLAEGFGIPVLEALSCGVPVITSSTTAIPEVIGEAGITVDPDDISELTGAMQKILSDTSLARNLAKAGPRQAAKFTWDIAAKQYFEAIKCAFF